MPRTIHLTASLLGLAAMTSALSNESPQPVTAPTYGCKYDTPVNLMRQGVNGRVLIQATRTAGGRITQVKILQTEPNRNASYDAKDLLSSMRCAKAESDRQFRLSITFTSLPSKGLEHYEDVDDELSISGILFSIPGSVSKF